MIDRSAPSDARQDELIRLVTGVFHDVNQQYFNGVIPTPACRLSTRMIYFAGKVFFRPWTMVISIPYHDRYGWDGELLDTIKHECVHLYLKHLKRPAGHTKEFKDICTQIGASLYAHDMPGRPYRYEWQCPNCKYFSYTRRWQSNVACGFCCRLLNYGRYTPKFKLVLARDLRDDTTHGEERSV